MKLIKLVATLNQDEFTINKHEFEGTKESEKSYTIKIDEMSDRTRRITKDKTGKIYSPSQMISFHVFLIEEDYVPVYGVMLREKVIGRLNKLKKELEHKYKVMGLNYQD